MRKIFLDVGAHEGETLEEVIKPGYLFDAIHCFEPMPTTFAKMSEVVRQWGAQPDPETPNVFHRAERSIVLNPFGLADRAGERRLYGAGVHASLYDADRIVKDDFDRNASTPCRFVEASEYFRKHVSRDDLVLVKMNCEGAEVEILENLLASGEIFKIDRIMVDFDVLKIVGMRDKPGKLLRRFRARGFGNYDLRFEVMRVRDRTEPRTHGNHIRNWLEGLSFARTIMTDPRPFGLRRRFRLWRARHIRRPIKMIRSRRP